MSLLPFGSPPFKITITNTAFVSVGGNDATGKVGKPNKPFLTVQGAMTAIGTMSPSSANIFIISLGPGTFSISGLVILDGVFIVGESEEASILNTAAGNVTLDTVTFDADANGFAGFSNLSIIGTAFTLDTSALTQTPSLYITNVFLGSFTAGGPAFSIVGNGATFILGYSIVFGTMHVSGSSGVTTLNAASTVFANDVTYDATVTDINSSAIQSSFFGNLTLTVTTVNAIGFNSFIYPIAQQLTIDLKTTYFASSDGIPKTAAITFTNGASYATNIALFNDAYGVGYTPISPANWQGGLVSVQNALDQITTYLDLGTFQLLDSTLIPSVDWENRILENNTGITTVDWQNNNLQDSAGTTSVDWQDRLLVDNSSGASVDWQNRKLVLRFV